MNLKTKIFIFMVLSLFSVSLVTLPAATAFTSDSFSQKVGDEYIWELKVSQPGSLLSSYKMGDQLKAIIIAANKTILTTDGANLWDTLWGRVYNNSITNRTWQLLMHTKALSIYNSTLGWASMTPELFIPHNQTAVNKTLYGKFYVLLVSKGDFHYTWTSGPNGYDGTMTAWNGSATGDKDQPKFELQFNANGLLQSWKEYRGTGSGWTLVSDQELLGGGMIPGFLAFPLLLILSIFVALQLLRAKKKPGAL